MKRQHRGGPVSPTDPSLAQGWATGEGGQVSYRGQATCLRPDDPPKVPVDTVQGPKGSADCVVGMRVIIGKCPAGVGIRLVGGKLVSEACAAQGLCVVGSGPPSGSATLGNCSAAGASGWALQPSGV